jgi:hypothetical protein
MSKNVPLSRSSLLMKLIATTLPSFLFPGSRFELRSSATSNQRSWGLVEPPHTSVLLGICRNRFQKCITLATELHIIMMVIVLIEFVSEYQVSKKRAGSASCTLLAGEFLPAMQT